MRKIVIIEEKGTLILQESTKTSEELIKGIHSLGYKNFGVFTAILDTETKIVSYYQPSVGFLDIEYTKFNESCVYGSGLFGNIVNRVGLMLNLLDEINEIFHTKMVNPVINVDLTYITSEGFLLKMFTKVFDLNVDIVEGIWNDFYFSADKGTFTEWFINTFDDSIDNIFLEYFISSLEYSLNEYESINGDEETKLRIQDILCGDLSKNKYRNENDIVMVNDNSGSFSDIYDFGVWNK